MTIGEKQIVARKGYQTQKENWRYTRYLEEGRERFLGTRLSGLFEVLHSGAQNIFVSNCLNCFQVERIMALGGLHLLILVLLELLRSGVGKLLLLIVFVF